MRATRFHEVGKPITIEDVPEPEVGPTDVLVKISGAGVCHSDLHVIDGEVGVRQKPITLGHENAGIVEKVGSQVTEVQPGDGVAVFGAWGCGVCKLCERGEENLCQNPVYPGVMVDGGWAEKLLVQHPRNLVKLNGLDPVVAAPLTDAALTPYRAVKKAMAKLGPGKRLGIIGVGGLGHMAIQIAKALSPATQLVAIDVSQDKLAMARDLGAEYTVDGSGDVGGAVKALTDGEGLDAIVDFVGNDATLTNAAAAVAIAGKVVVVGIAGGTLPFSFWKIPLECEVTTSIWGSRRDLQDVLELARLGLITPHIETQPLEAINDVLARLHEGKIQGRVVLTP
ncbi:MAG TPA: alcohol dehydrogenase [Porticoccaceae bacterium]|nr:alcohol dehydrogenase [Porticoccaceae bacterium]HCO61441.1 alcohol dehydrogenase [Porticoccaceae bacterium]